MTFLDLVRLAAGNLWRRKTRTLLTVLGVFIGTACITLMVALSLGSLEQFQANIMENSDLTRIEVYSQGGGAGAAKLDDAAIDRFLALPGVKNATGMLSMPSFLKVGRYECSNSVMVVDPDAMDFEFMEGGVFPENESIEFVIGSNARENFYDPHDTGRSTGWYAETFSEDDGPPADVGPDIEWLEAPVTYYPSWGDPSYDESTPERPAPKEYRARICGILKPAYDQKSYSIYMSREAAARIYSENRKRLAADGVKMDQFESAWVNANSVDEVADILTAIRDMGFQVQSDTEWINQMREEQARQQSQLVAIGMISLVVSAIGIANTMLASILERRREIGVMKVIGLSVRKINMMFLVEAAMIGLIGGLIGIAISYAVSGVVSMGEGSVNFLGMYFDQGVTMSIPWWLAAGSVLIAVVVGVLSGIYPAWKATRMSPLEAIRGTE